MDAMEELDAGLDILTGSNPALQPDCHILGKGVLPGIRYRHLGKSGLKVDKYGFLIFYVSIFFLFFVLLFGVGLLFGFCWANIYVAS